MSNISNNLTHHENVLSITSKAKFFFFLPRSYQIFWYYDKISKNNSQNRIFSKIRFLYMWVEIWHFQMIFKLVFVSWNIVGIISLHSFLKISIAYDSRYHATAILIARMSILECYLHQWSWRWCNLNSPHPAVYHTEQPGSGHLKQKGVSRYSHWGGTQVSTICIWLAWCQVTIIPKHGSTICSIRPKIEDLNEILI